MKELFCFLIFLMAIPLSCNGACISGDCKNGQGTETHLNGERYVGLLSKMTLMRINENGAPHDD